MSFVNPPRIISVVSGALLTLIAVLLTAQPGLADPGTGLLVMPDGSVVFGDPARNLVWRIDATGRPTILVRGKHAHLLRLDAGGVIVSEHLEYLGEERWRSSYWRLGPRDTVPADIEGPRTSREPFPDGMSLLLDRAERGYSWHWIDKERTAQALVRRRPDGVLETVTPSGWVASSRARVPLRFGQIANVAFAADGSVVVSELTRVVLVTEDGSVRVLAEATDFPRNPRAPRSDAYLDRLWGVCVDAEGGVYVADGGRRQVIIIRGDGVADRIVGLSDQYFPVGVAVTASDLYVLEYPDPGTDAPTGPRVRVVPLDAPDRNGVLGATPR